MKSAGVPLVVSKPYFTSFPKVYRDNIWTLVQFLKYVESTQ